MKHASLFTGIGGFDLAAERAGWENVFQVEYDKYCNKLLEKNFPNVKRYGDIYEFNGKPYRGAIDILSGGFPCQPFSQAGERKGKADDRYLWPEMLRIIREIKPSYVVCENVSGLITMDNGETLNEILTSLENEGYEVESFVIPACGVGAWHRRSRIWILAYTGCSYGTRETKQKEYGKQNKKGDASESEQPVGSDRIRVVADTNKFNDDTSGFSAGEISQQQTTEIRRYSADPNFVERGSDKRKSNAESNGGNYAKGLCEDVPNASSKGLSISGQKGVKKLQSKNRKGLDNRFAQSDWWGIEPDVGRVANGVPKRVDRLRGLGNAIVPQVAYEIFTMINNLNRK